MSQAVQDQIADLPSQQKRPDAAGNSKPGTDGGCPRRQMLRDLVSGQLEESRADQVLEHIDSCSRCQSVVDELEQKADRLAAAARLRKEKEADQERVNRLIKKAQSLGRTEKISSESTTVAVDSFVDGLKRCGLLPESEVDSLISEVDHNDSNSFARELVNRQKLTPFQARVLLKGKWKGLVLGNYVILEKLGQGGMGSVFKARHSRLGRIVCVKVINSAGRKSPGVMERFRNEARTIAALSHPNFVVAHDADEAEGVPFLVMEYIEGRDLSRQVTLEGPLKPTDGLRLIHQAAEALQYAHDSGVVHRDIKPHNLVMSSSDSGDSSIKILDMGLARFDNVLNEDSESEKQCAMTNTGVIMGTVDYMAPEQALRSRDADNRSDIYSLGCTLHFLLTGGAVFGGDTLMARLVAHREAPVPSIEKRMVEPVAGLDAVFQKMLTKDPVHRYQSMQDVADDLQAIRDGRTPAAAAGAASTSPMPVLDHVPTQGDQQTSQPAPQSGSDETPILERTRRSRRSVGKTIWITTSAVLIAFAMGALMSNQLTGAGGSGNITPERVAVTGFTDGLTTVPRLLIVIPDGGYEPTEVNAWEKAAEELNMAVEYASSQPKDVASTDGTDSRTADSALKDVKPEDFDLLVVTGGDKLHNFLKHQKGHLDRLIGSTKSDSKIVLTGSPGAFDEINRHWQLYDSKADKSTDEVHLSFDSNFVWTKHTEKLSKALQMAAVKCGLRAESPTL